MSLVELNARFTVARMTYYFKELALRLLFLINNKHKFHHQRVYANVYCNLDMNFNKYLTQYSRTVHAMI